MLNTGEDNWAGFAISKKNYFKKDTQKRINKRLKKCKDIPKKLMGVLLIPWINNPEWMG